MVLQFIFMKINESIYLFTLITSYSQDAICPVVNPPDENDSNNMCIQSLLHVNWLSNKEVQAD